MFGWIKSFFNKPQFMGNCVPRALYQGSAWLYQKQIPVRFIVQNLKPGVDHIQCQVLFDGGWQWSTQDRDYVTLGNCEFPDAAIIKTLSWRQLLQERINAIG